MKKKRFIPGRVVFWIALIAITVIQIFPPIRFLDFSLASSSGMLTNGLLIIPKVIRWDDYVKALVDGCFLLYFKNSPLINVLVVAAVLVTLIMASFTCMRIHWKLLGMVRDLILPGMIIPIHATLLPNYVTYGKLHLINGIQALLISCIMFLLPQGLFLIGSFMDSIPKEIEETVMIDRCRTCRMIVVLITPILKSFLVMVSVMTFLSNWNEFIVASTYLSSPKWKTLPFFVLEFTGMYSSNYTIQFAAMALTMAPMVVIYIISNRHITKGVTMEAVKG